MRYELESGNLDISFCIKQNHPMIQQRRLIPIKSQIPCAYLANNSSIVMNLPLLWPTLIVELGTVSTEQAKI